MKRTKQRLHRAACFSFMLLALFLIKTNIGFCTAPTLEWAGTEGLWNDGVNPDYGTTSDTFTFKVKYTDSDADAPYTGYPKVHILKGGLETCGDCGSFSMTDEGGGIYKYTTPTALSTAGNDYTYYFEAKDSNEDIAGFSSPTNEHTLTVVSGYVWVDYDTGSNTTGDGSQSNPYQTITYGISQASSGQAVRVLPRTNSPYEYQETFSMVSGVHVVSDNSSSGDSETTYNDPYSDYSTSMLTRTGRTIIKGIITFPNAITANVVLDGFTVYTNAGGNTVMDIQGKSPIVRNNIAYWSSIGGTYILKMDAATSGTHEPIIENNLFHRANTRGLGVGAYTSPIIQDNEIWAAATYPGIGLNRKGVPGGEITILNNHIFDCGGPGIGSMALAKNTTVTIQGNSIHDNGFDSTVAGKPLGAGISLARSGSPGTDLEPLEVIIGGSEPSQGNEIYNSTLAGIILDSNNAGIFPILIQNNDIYDNGKAGIVLIDAGFLYDPPGPTLPGDPIIAEVLDNTIYGQTQAGINIGGTTYADIAYNAIYDNYSGVTFNMASLEVDPDPPSSGTVNIEDNDIYSNTRAGIKVKDNITGEVTIAGNDLYQNDRAGICIENGCNLVINRNEIHDNIRGGIHTGTDVADDYFNDPPSLCTAEGVPYPCCTGEGTGTCGFIGEADSAILDVSQNKVYGNGSIGYGGGIDIRHASGIIYNNLIYENHKCGIRFGDYIYEIINNTVVDNGHVLAEEDWDDCTDVGVPYSCCTGEDTWTCTSNNYLCTDDGVPYPCCTGFETGTCTSLGYGGGIIYDDLDGAVNDPVGGYPLFSIPIRNNIIAYSVKAGIRVRLPTNACDTTGTYRDYNLLYGNNLYHFAMIRFGPTFQPPQLGRCPGNANEIFADPLLAGDYTLLGGAPAIDAGDDGNDMGAYGGSDPIDW